MQNAYSCMYTRRGLFATVLQIWYLHDNVYDSPCMRSTTGPWNVSEHCDSVVTSHYLQLAEHALYRSSIHSNIYKKCLALYIRMLATSADLVYPKSCIWEMVIFVQMTSKWLSTTWDLAMHEVCWGMPLYPNALAPQFQTNFVPDMHVQAVLRILIVNTRASYVGR